MTAVSTPRLRRLAADYESLRRRFSGHPHVTVEALPGTPPQRYRVVFRVPGLRRDGAAASVADVHVCDVELPRGYPREPPRVVAVTPVFHPNVAGIYCIGDFWSPAQPLADVVEKVGAMIQWQVFSTASALDPVAAAYGTRHPELFPVGHVQLGVAEPEVELLARAAAAPADTGAPA